MSISYREAQKNPEETLRYWQEFTRDFSFNPDQEQAASTQVNEIEKKNQMTKEQLHPAHGVLEKVKVILSEEDFKKLEASFSSQEHETVVAHCQELLSAHERTIKVDADVEKFIQLASQCGDLRHLRSGESKVMFAMMDKMIDDWKEDERFEKRLEASGHVQARQYVEQYHI